MQQPERVKGRYLVLDFETAATRVPGSICAVGLVSLDDGYVTDEYYSLVDPGCDFDPFCVRVHGIVEEMVAQSPDVCQMLAAIRQRMEDRILVAHNAGFDIQQLRAAIEKNIYPFPDFRFLCTLALSRRVFAGRESYRLTALSRQFGYVYQAHHALEDARACAVVLKECLRVCGDEDPCQAWGLQYGYWKQDGSYAVCKKAQPEKKRKSKKTRND